MESQELTFALTRGPVATDSSDSDDAAKILKRAIAGDRAAFEQVVIRHQQRVLVSAFHLLGNLHDAQDACQDVFLRLHRYLHRFDQRRDLLPWLYRVTVNVCRDIERRRPRLSHLDIEEQEVATGDCGPDEEVMRDEQKEMIRRALKRLSQNERTALVLRDIEGLSTKEVAGILGSSESTVRVHISTGRVKIRKFVDELEKRRS
jgi:RNA polymerase sigma-70 factor, ECF subfamily